MREDLFILDLIITHSDANEPMHEQLQGTSVCTIEMEGGGQLQ